MHYPIQRKDIDKISQFTLIKLGSISNLKDFKKLLLDFYFSFTHGYMFGS